MTHGTCNRCRALGRGAAGMRETGISGEIVKEGTKQYLRKDQKGKDQKPNACKAKHLARRPYPTV